MEGVIVNFRKSVHVQRGNQMIVQVNGVSNKDKAKALVGKTAVWASPAGKEIKGEVRAVHGNKGAVRILFEKGMPGQSVGKKIEIK